MFLFLNYLSKKELSSLSKFVHSPYFNSNRKLTAAFEYAESLYPSIREEDISAVNLAAAIGESNAMDPVNYRKLVSDFTKLLEEFLLQIEFENDDLYRNLLTLRYLRSRDIKSRFDRHYNELINRLNAEFSRDGDYYYVKAGVLSERFMYDYSKIKQKFSPLIQEQADAIDHFFLFEKLHLFHQMYHSSISSGEEGTYEKKWQTEILEELQKNSLYYKRNHPNIYIIYLTLKMFDEQDDDLLSQLIAYLNKHSAKLPTKKLRYYFSYVTAYCISKVNNGEENYRPLALDLFKRMDELDLLLVDNYMLDIDYNNVINIAISVGDIEWAEKFIEEKKNFLEKRIAKDAYCLAKSKVYFYKKDFSKMFELLHKVEFREPGYYVNAKFLLGRAYMESNEITRARYIVENLKQYRRANNELSDFERESIRSFLKYFNYVMKLCDAADPTQRKKIKREALAMLKNDRRFVPTRVWFAKQFS